ncbi:MAG: zinc ABC transporter substrate-binding protein [Pseudomonadales bacterium]|nr:zinc ABC transporter substrate-binding protein [Pseudomonadales bacterium]
MSQVQASSETQKLKVVTSFSILADLLQQIGGDHVSIVNLVESNSDAHMYRPLPSDAVAIRNADLVVFNGLGFEGWILRLLENDQVAGMRLVASNGVDAIRQDGETDPHAWQSFRNIRIYVNNIGDALVMLLPEHADDLMARREAYLQQVRTLEDQLLAKLSEVPTNDRVVVTSHDAFGYLGRELDIEFLAPLGLSLDSEASAEDVAELIDQIRARNVTALFVENINNPRLLNSIAEETGVAIGGSLYSDALSESAGPAATYLDMMRFNIESLIKALK